ncbi:MAG: hypothetical protein AAGI53_01665 [Planctomycetota bacterium]
MSRAPTTVGTASGSRTGVGVSLGFSARVAEASATLGLVGGLGPTVIATRTGDLLSHHRSSVLRRVGRDFPGKRRAQRFMASRLQFYSRTRRPYPNTYAEATGEAFAAGINDDSAAGGPIDITLLERGGRRVSAGGPMAIPLLGFRNLHQSAPALGRVRQFRDQLKRNRYDVTPSGLLVADIAGTRARGARSLVAGVLRRSTVHRPLLGFFAEFDRIEPRHAVKLERDLGKLVTVAGRAALQDRLVRHERVRALGAAAFAEHLKMNPGDHAGARKAALEISRRVNADSIGRGLPRKGGA